MEKKTVKLLLVLMAAILLPAVGWARESSLLVELPVKINASIEKLKEIEKDSDRKFKDNETRIRKVAEQVGDATSYDERVSLRKKYLALRAENLKVQVEKTIVIQGELESIAVNMERLQKAREDSDRLGIGAGIKWDDPNAKAAISSTFQGISAILEQVRSVRGVDGGKLRDMMTTAKTLDDAARSFFNGRRDISLEEQKDFIMQAAALTRSVRLLLQQEHDWLLGTLYYVNSRNIVVKVADLRKIMFGGVNVGTKFQGMHDMDREVLDDSDMNVKDGADERYSVDISNLGKGY